MNQRRVGREARLWLNRGFGSAGMSRVYMYNRQQYDNSIIQTERAKASSD